MVSCIVEQTASDIGNLISRFKFQGKRGGDRFGLGGAGGGLEIDVILGQFRGFSPTL